MHELVRHRVFGWWGRLVSARAGWVLALAALAAAAAVALTAGRLTFDPDRNNLIDQDLDWNQRYLDWINHFEGTYDLWVIVDAGLAYQDDGYRERRGQTVALLTELTGKLAADPHVGEVAWRFRELDATRAVRTLHLKSFREELDRARGAKPLLTIPTPDGLIHDAAQQLLAAQNQTDQPDPDESDDTSPAAVAAQVRGLAELVDAFADRLADETGDGTSFGQLMDDPWGYYEFGDGRLFVVRVTPRKTGDAMHALAPAIAAIREIINDTSAKFDDIEVGLTGIEVVEADETEAATFDSTLASIVAFVLIGGLLVLAFQSLRMPALLMMTLIVGMAWSFGFTTLTVGHLQLISVVFAVILLGLGVAFGIHLASRFELARHCYPDGPAGFRKTLRNTFEVMGPGVITGAVTTAVAFATTTLTDFKGVAEMGLIAAGGVLLCLLAMFTVFPALLRLFKPMKRHVTPVTHRWVTLFDERWISPFTARPGLTLTVAGILVGLSIAAASQMRFDFNLLNLQPRDVPSVQWQRRVTEIGGESIWSAVSVCDSLDEARARTQQFLDLDVVAQVRGVGMLFPDELATKDAELAQLKTELTPALEAANTKTGGAATDDLITQVTSLRPLLRLGMLAAPAEVKPALREVGAAMDRVIAATKDLSPADKQARLDRLRREYTEFRRAKAAQITRLLDISPITLNDLPSDLVRSYVSTGNGPKRYALEVHPNLDAAGDEGVTDPLDPRFLPRFIDELEAVDPNITGVIVQIYKSGDLIFRSYQQAGLYALLAVFVLVLIDFRSLHDAVCSLAPVAAGFAVTFGIMWAVGMRINAANIIVLPLMFGIGVDSGVHILHRYRMEPARRPLGLTHGTGKGVTLTSLTTMIGFGAMMLARHRGIASLGFTLTLGIGMTMLACWTIMPAWLELRSRKQS